MPPATVKQTDLQNELLLGALVTNGFNRFLGEYFQSLPPYVDDVERDFGADIYDRMMNDAAVGSSIQALKTEALSAGVRFLCPIDRPSVAKPDPEKQKVYDRAEEIRGAVEHMMDRLQQPIEDILEEMLDCLAYGHKLAEQTYEPRDGLMALTKLRVKPRAAYGLVVDQWMNVQGCMAGRVSQTVVNETDIVPRSKFWLLSGGTKDGDPRGRSMLRAAYNPWYLKMQCWPMYLKHLAQFGTPSIWAELPESAGNAEVLAADGTVTLDAQGNPAQITAAEALLSKLINFANGTAIAVENGTKLNKLEINGDGGAYIRAIDLFDRQITRAVLIAIRTVMESEHGSKADSGTAENVVGKVAQWIRRRVEIGIFRDVLKPLVRMNWGDEAAEEMCPVLALSDIGQEDQIEFANAVANLARASYLHDSQKPGIDAKLGLPERDYEAEMADKAEQKLVEDERRAEMDRMLNPASGDGEQNQSPSRQEMPRGSGNAD